MDEQYNNNENHSNTEGFAPPIPFIPANAPSPDFQPEDMNNGDMAEPMDSAEENPELIVEQAQQESVPQPENDETQTQTFSAPLTPAVPTFDQPFSDNSPQQPGFIPPIQPQLQGAYPPSYDPAFPPAAAAKAVKKKKHPGLVLLAVLISLVLISTVLLVGLGWLDGDESGNAIEGDNTALQIQNTPEEKIELPESGTVLSGEQIVEKLQPSVVGIVLFSTRSPNSVGSATGIVMGEDSTGTYTYIITAAHVISTANQTAKVQFEDGKQTDAEVVGYDTRTDLGVLRIKQTGLTAAEFGNSDAMKKGEAVWVIGNPAGMDFYGSVTTGVVSNIGRDMKSENEMKLIQLDAAINPGNSGGPLVNKYGQVVGIISLKLVSNDIEGMGFAIPSTPAKNIIDKLIQNGRVPDRARLGIEYTEASSSFDYSRILQIKGLPTGSLIITKIDSNGALANTDARVNDMITEVNGKKMTEPDMLLELIQSSKPGDSLTLSLVRVFSDYSTEELTIKVTLVEDTTGSSPEETTDLDILPPF